MQNYENLIYEKIKGNTPKEKYDFLCLILKLLQQIAYPRRGEEEELWTIQNAANEIQSIFNIKDCDI